MIPKYAEKSDEALAAMEKSELIVAYKDLLRHHVNETEDLYARLKPKKWEPSGKSIEESPHEYCADCGTLLSPCECRPDCRGANCYQPGCS